MCGQGVLELDLWLAAGMVKKLDITYIGLEVYGTSHACGGRLDRGRSKPAWNGRMQRFVAHESGCHGCALPAGPFDAWHRYA